MIDDNIFDFAYLLAFRDATQKKAYLKNFDKENEFRIRKDTVYDKSKTPVHNYIESIFKGKHPDPKPIICSLFDDERQFTFVTHRNLSI